MKTITDVDTYIFNAPKEIQDKLRELRAVIKEVAPKAEEKISYGMPYYGYKGRLCYFAYFKKHIGLYITPPIIEEYKKDLTDYETSMATIRFPLSEKLPLPLIKKLIQTRVKINEQSYTMKRDK